ncbi:MAG: amidohydrolase family protein [Isosphaeraceae bacterium]
MRSHRFHPFVLVLAAATSATAQEPAAKTEPYDVLIRNGRIVDGTGNPWFHGDVAVRGGRIAAVGRLDEATTAREVIEARGMVVAPGFIDIHSHSDMPLLRDGSAQSKIRQGVTTEVLGEDTSAGPAMGKHREARVELDGKPVTWRSLGDYFDVLESRGIAVNVASYVGLGTLLECVRGDALGRPDAAQLEEMQALLDQAMRDGAIGLSSMLASPRELAVTTEDIVALCRVVRQRGGLFSSHIRNEGTGVFEAVKEAIAVGERAGVPVDIIHLKIADQSLWGRMGEIAGLIEQARGRGVDVQANVYPYTWQQ